MHLRDRRRFQPQGTAASPALRNSLLLHVQEKEFSSCFADGYQGHVIVLRHRTGELSHVPDDPFYNRLRAIVRAGANRLHHAINAKLVSIGVKRLSKAVGVENETIVALERYREIDSKPIEHAPAVNSDHHSRRLYRRYGLGLPLVP